ncbi:MAG: DUF1743 domain-containing protein [Candidatus Thorarchaeota archaeon]|nr:DUF1743 domain-containing protein [Candidatus Thorarchaeota archaeon]
MSEEEIHLGLDDIDSPSGGCTTHFASLLVEYLSKHSVNWNDYPNLIRLNPGIPFRTRGNGAVSLRFTTDTIEPDEILHQIELMINDYVDRLYPNTNPGVVIVTGKIPEAISRFSKKALWRTIPIALAKRIIDEHNLVHYSSGNGRGLIGGLASIGNQLLRDHTYEYIAYRSMDQCGDTRGVDALSVKQMDEKMGDSVFSNVDDKKYRILIEPHGPDPVLYGIRGETAKSVIRAASYIKSEQKVERWTVFRTNQGTGEHLVHTMSIGDLRPYMAAIVHGFVETPPRMMEGGYVIFKITDRKSVIDCAAYEPTRSFRETVMKLRRNDEIRLHVNVRPRSKTHGLTLNVEGLEVLKLSPLIQSLNPLCPHCLRRMKSAGRGKGYKCDKCGFRGATMNKIETHKERPIEIGLYLPPLSAQRHLTRPFARNEHRNSGRPKHLIEKWHSL